MGLMKVGEDIEKYKNNNKKSNAYNDIFDSKTNI